MGNNNFNEEEKIHSYRNITNHNYYDKNNCIIDNDEDIFQIKNKEKIEYISDEKRNEMKLTNQIKDINLLINNLSEKLKNTSSNLDILKIELNGINDRLNQFKNYKNNYYFNEFPRYNDYFLDEMRHEFIQKKKAKFKSEIKNEIKNEINNKIMPPILDSIKKKDEEISDLKGKNNQLISEIKNLKSQITTNNNQIKDQISNEVDNLKKKIETEKIDLKEQIYLKIENSIKQIDKELKDYYNNESEKKVQKYNSKILELNNNIESNNSEFGNFKKTIAIEIKTIQKQISIEVETLKNQINSKIDTIEKKNYSKFDDIQKLNEKNIKEIENFKKRYESEMESYKNQLEKFNTIQNDLRNQNLKQDKELKTINDRISKNDEKIKDAKEQIEIINKNSRKNTLNIIYESFRKFSSNFKKDYSSIKHKKQKELKLQLFSDKKYANVGLNNIGNNCYMNSVIQILKNIPKFTYNISILNDKSDNFLFSLKNLLISICNNNISSFSPKEFKKYLGLENKLFAGNNQYDSTIFYIALLNIIHKKLNISKKENYKKLDMSKHANKSLKEKLEIWKTNFMSKNQSFIFDLYYGFYANETECESCKNKTQIIQTMNYLDFPIVTENGFIKSLEECFENYQKVKSLQDYCSKCQKFGLNQHCILLELPPILIINLKRVGEQSSYFNDIEIPFQLDMEKLIKYNKNYSFYELRGFIKHKGDENSGHNYAFCKNMFDDKWYIYNDNNCSLINNEPKLDKIFFLCYIKVGSDAENIYYLNQIIDLLNNKTK